MPVLRSGIKEAVSNVAVPSTIGTKERGCERFEKDGTRRGTVSWFEMCRCCVGMSVHGTALRAHREGRRERRAGPDAEERGTRRVRDVREMYPYIPGREDMAEQAVGVGRGGATSRTIRAEWEARAGLLRRGQDGRGGVRLGLWTSAGSSFGDLASREFMELSHTYKEQGAARRGISGWGLVNGQG